MPARRRTPKARAQMPPVIRRICSAVPLDAIPYSPEAYAALKVNALYYGAPFPIPPEYEARALALLGQWIELQRSMEDARTPQDQ